MSSLQRIMPFLRPIEDLLQDPTITEVMVNRGGRQVFIERDFLRSNCAADETYEMGPDFIGLIGYGVASHAFFEDFFTLGRLAAGKRRPGHEPNADRCEKE